MRLGAFLALALLLSPACASLPAKPFTPLAVSGKITDGVGRPIPNVRLTFRPGKDLDEIADYRSANADSSGSYALELISGTWQVYIYVPSGLSYVGWARGYEVSVSSEHPKLDFHLESYRVEGRVIGPTGSVLDSGYVSAGNDRDEYGQSQFSGGRFAMTLPPGSYSFYARSGWMDDGLPLRILEDVAIGADTSFDIALVGDPVTGAVSGPGGAPLSNLRLLVDSNAQFIRARTGTNGSYTAYVPPGTYWFTCAPNSTDAYILTRVYPPRAITGPTVINFDLSGVEWSGVVRSSATMQPVSGVLVRAFLYADQFARYAYARTDAGGSFRLVLEPQRDYLLDFSGSGVASVTYPGIFASADTTFDVLLDPPPIP